MILDGRAANQRFSQPPHVDLLTAEGLSSIEVFVDDDPELATDLGRGALRALRVALGVADVENCFHRVIMPPWMSALFCYEPVLAAEVDPS
eukprot:7044478-Pyramimonas_sp.AAC.1